jgi:hypothetical protein
LVAADLTAWETDQFMRMRRDRFNAHSGTEGDAISLDQPDTLKLLENSPALLMYECG